ncbi:MAG: CocE/NonD family hydrolase [Gemmatimonadetes bacterium]|nr:CocE/NonD family hydrolase [Gemmatimonadota bacterium]
MARRIPGATAALLIAALVPPSLDGQIVNRFGVRVPMRDRVELVANLWLPAPTGKHPTILLRTPYDKTAQYRRYRLDRYLQAGYAVMVQDTRGRGDSEGRFDFYFPEGKDGYDTIEWIARQSWSNGRVGMDGGSYLGAVQWLAARERPPHLACIIPTASSGRLFDEIPYLGGAFRLDWALDWLNLTAERVSQGDLNELVKWDSLLLQRPLARLDSLLGRPMALYQRMLAHSTLDAYWRRIQFGPEDYARIEVPVLTVTGWFDGDQPGALSYWDGMEALGRPNNHYLIVGPWNHGQTYLGGAVKQGEFALDSTAIFPIQEERIRFFDWCLKRATPSYDAPRARVYLTGRNGWLAGDRYPLREVSPRPIFLASGGRANTLNGDGALRWEPSAAAAVDTFRYDPDRPVPSRPLATDHRPVEERADVLVYTTEVLTDPLELLGRPIVKLWAATDGPDTDFTAKLLDVYPDGRAVLLGPSPTGVRRARYRNGYLREELVTPNEPIEYTIEMADIGHRLAAGHRLRLEISSSAFPFIDRNANTGRPVATDTTWRVARQTVFHGAERPSRVVLPVLAP